MRRKPPPGLNMCPEWTKCPTEHIGNTFSEHMGNTFGHLRETRNALEGVIQDGRADALCGPVDGGREDGGVVPRVRYLAQDRLQTLQPVQRFWGRGLDRSEPPAVSARQSPAFSDRELDPAAQREALELGSTKDPGQDQASSCCIARSNFRPSAQSMRCWIGTAWSAAGAKSATGPKARC